MVCDIGKNLAQPGTGIFVSNTTNMLQTGEMRSLKRQRTVSNDFSSLSQAQKTEIKRTKRGPGERQRGPRHWTEEEDQLLKAAVVKLGARQWKVVALSVPGRTHTQCLQRWNKVLKPGLRKGPWTVKEDEHLRKLVELELPKAKEAASRCAEQNTEVDPASLISWSSIAEAIPGRSIKQCRERWCYNLNPVIKKGSWTPEEDALLLALQKKNGNRWAQIARLIPGRTEHTVKTRFRSILRARKREWKTSEDTLLLELHRKLGSRWDEIATHFPNRTKNAVNTRFKQLVDQRWKNANSNQKKIIKTNIPAKIEAKKPLTPIVSEDLNMPISLGAVQAQAGLNPALNMLMLQQMIQNQNNRLVKPELQQPQYNMLLNQLQLAGLMGNQNPLPYPYGGNLQMFQQPQNNMF